MCPKNVEATMYSVVMSTINFGCMVSNWTGAIVLSLLGITENNFKNLWISILITNTSTLIPLITINKINFDDCY